MPNPALSRPRYPDRPQLPDTPYLLGIQIAGIAIDGDNTHALARTALTEQLDTIAQDPEPDYGFIDLYGVCSQPARYAQTWGPWDEHSLILRQRPDICPECRWRVALELGTTGQLLNSLIPTSHDDGVDAATIDRAYGRRTTLTYRICQKILTNTYGRDGDTDLALQLLVHATRHRLIPLTRDEDCCEGACDHATPADCYTGTTACRACTVHAGSWAGEWAGQSVYQCTVPGPCGVLTTLADTYKVVIGGDRP